MPYINKKTGERINDQDFRVRASQQVTPTVPVLRLLDWRHPSAYAPFGAGGGGDNSRGA